jgi:hypothetical protein
VLASDIADFVKKYEELGFSSLPEASLVVLTSRFIDCADACLMKGGKVSLAYHLSEKHNERMTQIRQDGLGPYASVSADMEAAYTHPNRRNKLLIASSLPSISESDTIEVEHGGTNHLGWIVATTEDVSSICFPAQGGQPVRVSSGFAIVRTLTTSIESLPLVCFDTSLCSQDTIRRLWSGLSQICIEFLQDSETFVEQQEIECMIAASSPCKKACPDDERHEDEDEVIRQTLEQTKISSQVTIMPELDTGSNILESEERDDDGNDTLIRAIVNGFKQTGTTASSEKMPETATSTSFSAIGCEEQDNDAKDNESNKGDCITMSPTPVASTEDNEA